jgi:phospholipid-binding lipoprotein MlaA
MTDVTPSLFSQIAGFATRGLAIGGLGLLVACAKPVPSAEINDPFEKENRSMHAFNVGLDRKFLKPAAEKVAGDGTGPASMGLKHFVDNLDGPRDVVNNVLQLRLGRAVHNGLRFAINTTIGLGGIFDPATAMGAPAKPTDFGETLYIWGLGEGHYLELPVLGPSTSRDALGTVVDFALNPVSVFVKAPESYALTAAKLADKVESRARHADIVDSILYDSADSYAQARLLYLQNRRYTLGQTTSDANTIDVYEDPYGQ